MRLIDADAAIDTLKELTANGTNKGMVFGEDAVHRIEILSSAQPERKTGHWILDRSGAYCCNKCMEPCASYVMMKPRDKFCKMCGAKMEGGTE